MNILQNLTVFYNHLSPDSTYRNLCKGILEHLEEASEGTIYDLAELTNSSRTTIWRMIQKLGYTSYTEFRHELKKAVENYIYYNRILPLENCDSAENIKSALINQMESALDYMNQYMDVNVLEEIADAIHKADNVHFYVPFQSSSIYSLQQNLAISGIGTAYFSLIPEMLEESKELTEDSIVFISTIEHAETMNLQSVFESIRNQKATIFGFTTSKSKYKDYIDYELLSGTVDKVAEGVTIFNMYFNMLSEIYRINYIKK